MPRNLLNSLKNKFYQTNLDQKVDQVVAMIFRVSQSSHEELQLLFLQRAYSEKDHYSGDVCFPGGHRQKQQSCFKTAVRQTQQQTNLSLNKQDYIGALSFTFTTRYGKSKVRGNGKDPMQLYMGILMFEIDRERSKMIKLQEQQIRSFKWINLKEFFQGSCDKFDRWIIGSHQLIQKAAKLLFPAYRIGMDRHLWGLTLYTMIMFVDTVKKMGEDDPNIKIKISNQFYNKLIYHCTDLQVQGNQQIQKMAKKLYVEGRIGFLNAKL